MKFFNLQVRVEGGKTHDLGRFLSSSVLAWSVAYRRAATEGFDILDRKVKVEISLD